ncbi:hypothetical protein BFW01_g2004 [Lasiodiplodia theobromae]|nr:hypothetical protein BFW01_g2004 [Lasiodiplodia theobromae]
MRQTPALYGERVHDYGRITGWKSGAAFAAKNFGVGLAEGLTDVFVQPVKGGRKEGAVGVVKGLGKGSVGMLAKMGSAGLGVLAYTGQGIYKSAQRSRHRGTRERVMMRRCVEGGWLVKREKEVDREAVVARYDMLG